MWNFNAIKRGPFAGNDKLLKGISWCNPSSKSFVDFDILKVVLSSRYNVDLSEVEFKFSKNP